MSVLSHLPPSLAEVDCGTFRLRVKRVSAVDTLKQGRIVLRMLGMMTASTESRSMPLSEVLELLAGRGGEDAMRDVEAVVCAGVVEAWDPDDEIWVPFRVAPAGTTPAEAESGEPGVRPLDHMTAVNAAHIAWTILEHSVSKEVVARWTAPFRLVAFSLASLGLAGPSLLDPTKRSDPAPSEPVDGGPDAPSAVDGHSDSDSSAEGAGGSATEPDAGQEGDQAHGSDLDG